MNNFIRITFVTKMSHRFSLYFHPIVLVLVGDDRQSWVLFVLKEKKNNQGAAYCTDYSSAIDL